MKPFWEPEVGRRYRLLRNDGQCTTGQIIEVTEIKETTGISICYNESMRCLTQHGIYDVTVKGNPNAQASPFFEHIPG